MHRTAHPNKELSGCQCQGEKVEEPYIEPYLDLVNLGLCLSPCFSRSASPLVVLWTWSKKSRPRWQTHPEPTSPLEDHTLDTQESINTCTEPAWASLCLPMAHISGRAYTRKPNKVHASWGTRACTQSSSQWGALALSQRMGSNSICDLGLTMQRFKVGLMNLLHERPTALSHILRASGVQMSKCFHDMCANAHIWWAMERLAGHASPNIVWDQTGPIRTNSNPLGKTLRVAENPK